MNVRVRGRVQQGRLVVDDPIDLPEDSEVDVFVVLEDLDDLDEAERARLHEALRASKDELDRGEVFPIEDVLADL